MQAEVSADPPWSPGEIERALKRCRELDDPVRHWYYVAIWGTVLGTLLGVGAGYLESRPPSGGSGGIGLVLLASTVVVLGVLITWLALRPLTRSARFRKLLYVRAFSRDDDSLPLRRALRAALPAGYALEGIRQPRKRPPWWSLIFGQGFVALRYAGSEQFELESADHNWIARLLATARKASAILIDATEVTKNVHDEIRMALLLAGVERCYFLIGEHQDPAKVAADIEDQMGVELGGLPEENWIRVPEELGEIPEEFVETCRKSFASLPSKRMGVSDPAFQFARSRVSEGDWPTPWWSTMFAKTLAILAFLLLLGVVLPGVAGQIFTITISVAFGFYYIFTLIRLWRIGSADRRLGKHDPKLPRTVIVGAAAFSLAVLSPVATQALLGKVEKSHETAKLTLLFADFRELWMTVRVLDDLFRHDLREVGEVLQLDGRDDLLEQMMARGYRPTTTQLRVVDGEPYKALVDPWGSAIRLTYGDPPVQGPAVVSAGADLKFGTADDLSRDTYGDIIFPK